MRKIFESLRAARYIELGLLLILLALLGLTLLNGTEPRVHSESTELERRLVSVLEEIDGAGRVSVMITQTEDGVITGAVIVADGLDSVRTSLAIQNAVRTLLDVDLDRVCVISRKGGPE